MISFKNDYSEGALPEIMEALVKTNLEQTVGYGMDEYCGEAAEKIKNRIKQPNAQVHFLVGGTQANQTCISAFLRPHEAVIGVKTAHINVHETGAIEATGHKVVTVTGKDGKITPEEIKEAVGYHSDEHMVKPKMVYISNSTEIGTIYTKKELEEVSACCKELKLYLYLDGARLGSALTAEGNDLTIEDIAALTDAFYIGGTKNGALFGEAVVLVNPELQNEFRYAIKQHGGMLAKGRLLGIQFDCLFTEELFFKAGAHANRMAMKLKQGLTECGITFLADSVTNQQFPIFTKEEIEVLDREFLFEYNDKVEENKYAIRFCTSWATREEDVKRLIEVVKEIVQR
ncbi:MAG: low specificity L-threonine aldolase [Lachnospiraceae bacterium]|nr:low specificity L-threonine aldolase [Lachnospiraceae bacterium]